MKKIVMAILAHVDAGKTTLGEYMLYRTRAIRTRGSVDAGDTHLDVDEEERARGITIYSSEAHFSCGDTEFALIDTPGHADFTPEAVRALAAADCAVLVVAAPAGVQGHTRSLARILERLGIPTVIFANKTDLPFGGREELLAELCELGTAVDFTGFASEVSRGGFPEELRDALSLRDDGLLEAFLCDRATPERCLESARRLFRERRVLPVLMGSARDGTGCDALLYLMERLSEPRFVLQAGEEGVPSGLCYKVVRDSRGQRLCLCRAASGTLQVRSGVGGGRISELRRADGAKYTTIAQAEAGELFAAAGLPLRAGESYGGFRAPELPDYSPALCARVTTDVPQKRLLETLELLADEEPSMRVLWDEAIAQVSVEVSGEIGLEVLEHRLLRRAGIHASFSRPDVVCRETLGEPVIGRGHYEPLRHYAEVHLLMEPAPRGEGITFRSRVHTDVLPQQWQNLVRQHVLERVPRGVLTGSELTDVRVTLTAAAKHEEHTEGGDFREAVRRAIRQGLMKGKSVLLEPYAFFVLEVPSESGGRVSAELRRRGAGELSQESRGGLWRISGRASERALLGLTRELASLTRGQASFEREAAGYEPMRNAEAYIAARGYDPMRDPTEDASSVFCGHGAGFVIPWNEADRYMHLKD